MTMLIITDALIDGEGGGFALHPAMSPIRERCQRMRRQWFACTDNNPLGWYAALVGTGPAALLAARCPDVAASARQAWVASPFHAMLGRDTVRLLPETDFPWTSDDADWLAGELNPLLSGEGMHLHACGAALILTCDESLDATPAPFASIAGHLLPNRHPEGADGGRMMRLLAEVQMFLHNRPQPTREGYPPMTGLWLWGACDIPAPIPVALPTVESPDPCLQSLGHAHGAALMVCQAAQIDALVAPGRPPKHVLLAGAGHAVLLHRSLIPSFSKQWKAKLPGCESDLLHHLRNIAHAS